MADVFDLQAHLTMDTSDFAEAVRNVIAEQKRLADSLSSGSDAMRDVERTISTTRAELDRTESAMNEISTATSELTAESRRAEAATEDLTGEVEDSRDAFNRTRRELDNTADETRRLSEELDGAQDSAGDLTDSADELTDAYGDADEATGDLDTSTKDLGSTADGTAGKLADFAEFLKNGFVTAVKVGIGTIAAASAAVGALVKESVESFGAFEQLKGGSQKIFEGMDFTKIQGDADRAFRELNMSATEYFDTINGAGASFVASMGSDKAYDTARRGLLAISDYASGTGASISELSEKYALITRSTGSYQSIADQFSGILPQTSEAFLEQAQAAGFLSEAYKSLSDVEVGEYQQAVTQMIEKGVETLNLSGNTAREAGETLTGSFATAKAAWQDLVVAFSDPDADLSMKIDNFVDSSKAALENIVPTIVNAMGGVGRALTELAPVIGAELPKLVSELLPPLVQAATQLISSITGALPGLIESITNEETVDTILTALTDMLSAVMNGLESIVESAPDIIPKLLEQVGDALVNGVDIIGDAIINMLPELESLIVKTVPVLHTIIVKLLDSVADISEKLLPDLLADIAEMVGDVIVSLMDSDNAAVIYDSFIRIIESVITALESAREPVFDAVTEVFEALFEDFLPEFFENHGDALGESFVSLMKHAIEYLISTNPFTAYITWAWSQVFSFFDGLGEQLYDVTESLTVWFEDVVAKAVSWLNGLGVSLYDWTEERKAKLRAFIDDIINKIIEVKDGVTGKVSELVSSIISIITELPSKALEVGHNLVTGLWDGISGAAGWLGDKISGFADGVVDGFRSAFDINSPSGIMRDLIGENLALGIGEGFLGTVGDVVEDMGRSLQTGINALLPDMPEMELSAAIPDTAIETAELRPLAAMGGGDTYNNFEINVNFDGMKVASDMDIDEMSDRAVEKISERLANLEIFSARAHGGVIMP